MSNILSGTIRRLTLLYRVLAMLVTATLIVVIFPHTRQGTHYDYKVGAIWRDADLTAPFDFAVMKSQDEIKDEQEAECQKAILYYRVNDSARTAAYARLNKVPAGERQQLRRQMDSVYRIGYIANIAPASLSVPPTSSRRCSETACCCLILCSTRRVLRWNSIPACRR